MKVSDYIVEFLNRWAGIDTVFTITGGYSMHLSDSIFHHAKYTSYFQLHEQACGYSALGYAHASGKIPVVCTSAGIAAVNALSPCLSAYQDSVAMLFLAGQVNSRESIGVLNKSGYHPPLRHYAGADSDILSMASSCTKYAAEINCVDDVVPVLNKVVQNLLGGRPGPVFLSVCLDIQVKQLPENVPSFLVPAAAAEATLEEVSFLEEGIYKLLATAQKPVIFAGNGIRLARCKTQLVDFLERTPIPVLTTIMSTDVIEEAHPCYVGRIGIVGHRAGNFAMQNSDLILCLGCRLAQGVVGYRPDWFARGATIICVDIDPAELAKDKLPHPMVRVQMDLTRFFAGFEHERLKAVVKWPWWQEKCAYWRKKWEGEMPHDMDPIILNPYPVLARFFEKAPSQKIITGSSGSIVVVLWHMIRILRGDLFLHSSQGDMGFELTAAIGAAFACRAGAVEEKTIFAVLGEGSLQLHLQELQTIVFHRLPIKILLFNNGGYGANIITQKVYFQSKYGCDSESGLSFPCHEKIAKAYGIQYRKVSCYDRLDEALSEFLDFHEAAPIILEVFCCVQARTPKLSAVRNEDGTFKSRPLEDMDPFLSREELVEEMTIECLP